jgi:protein transport protein SEC24
MPKMLGGDKEHTLLAPADGDDGAFYKSKSVDFSRQQISVDTFLFSPNYTDVATLGAMSRYTAGHVYHYPGFNAAVDGERLARDLVRNLTRTTGFEAVMRLRCSRGVSITNFYGNFFIRGTDLLALPNVTTDTAFNVELAHDKDDPLQPGSVVAIQAALLYTTSGGERRICVHTMAKPVTSLLAELFRRVDPDAVANTLAKVALDHALRHGLPAARKYTHRVLVDIVRAFKAASSSPYGGGMGGGGMVMGGPGSTRPLPSMGGGPGQAPGGDGGAMLPDCLATLPALALGLQKCTLYRGGEAIRSDERAALVYRMLTMPTDAGAVYVSPRLFGLHDMPEGAGRPDAAAAAALPVDPATGAPLGHVPIALPPLLPLTAESLHTGGVYVLDNAVETYVWVGRAANPGLVQALWGVGSLDGIDPAALTLPPQPNDFSGRVQALLGHLRAHVAQQQRLRVVREGANDAGEARFHWHLVQDRQAFNGGSVTLAEYVAVVQREAAMGAMAVGGGGGGGGGGQQ